MLLMKCKGFSLQPQTKATDSGGKQGKLLNTSLAHEDVKREEELRLRFLQPGVCRGDLCWGSWRSSSGLVGDSPGDTVRSLSGQFTLSR